MNDTAEGNSETYNERGCDYYTKGQCDRAIKNFTIAIEFNDSNKAKYLTNRGTVYFYKNNFRMAHKDFNSAIFINEKYALPYSKRGFIFLEKYERELYFGREKKKDLKSAISDYTEAIRFDPCESGFYRNRAAAYDLLNESENAFADACRAIELENPPNKINLINRGIAYAIKGDWYHAFEDFNQAGKPIFPNEPMTIENIEIFEILKKSYHRRFLDIRDDKFYITLRQFAEENGIDVFEKRHSYALLLDFLKNENKKDFLLFYYMVERQIHKEIMKTKQLEETRKVIIDKFRGLAIFQKNDLNRMVDIIFCLTQNEDFFQQRGKTWEKLLPLN